MAKSFIKEHRSRVIKSFIPEHPNDFGNLLSGVSSIPTCSRLLVDAHAYGLLGLVGNKKNNCTNTSIATAPMATLRTRRLLIIYCRYVLTKLANLINIEPTKKSEHKEEDDKRLVEMPSNVGTWYSLLNKCRCSGLIRYMIQQSSVF
jgi:hypothetical protein